MVGCVQTGGLKIGETTLRPSTVMYAVLVFLVVWAVMQAFQRWLSDTYLPKTELDAGARNSISTVTRYLGIIAAVLWGLTALSRDAHGDEDALVESICIFCLRAAGA